MNELNNHADKKELEKEKNRIWVAKYLNKNLSCHIDINTVKIQNKL